MGNMAAQTERPWGMGQIPAFNLIMCISIIVIITHMFKTKQEALTLD